MTDAIDPLRSCDKTRMRLHTNTHQRYNVRAFQR